MRKAAEKHGPMTETEAERLVREHMERKGVTRCEPMGIAHFPFPAFPRGPRRFSE
jgi:hypothetical protein